MSQLKYKNVKSFYYLKEILLLLIPRIFYRLILQSQLKKIEKYDRKYILSRVNYYNRKEDEFSISKKDELIFKSFLFFQNPFFILTIVRSI